jgi:hypothetical protein
LGLKESDSDDDAEVPVHCLKAKDIQFVENDDGHFILPPLHNYRTVREKQRVVRGYIGAVYRMSFSPIFVIFLLTDSAGQFTDQKSAAFPFILAAKDDQEIYDPVCVPDDFVLSDPDHLTVNQISSLYRHWEARQDRNLPPFVVLKPGPNHQAAPRKSRKGKGKERQIDYEHVSTDDENAKSLREGERQWREEQDDEEDISRRVKFPGPKGRTDGRNVAGPSKHPSTTQTSAQPPKKGKRVPLDKVQSLDLQAEDAPVENSRPRPRPKSNKRKAEEDPEPRPPKSLKTGPPKKSGRKADDPVAKPAPVSNFS